MKVAKIEPAGYADVYNMEVEDTNDFALENGVIAHNCYDEWRYVCMENPIAPPVKKEVKPRPYNPLDTEEDILSRIDRYEIYR